MPSSRSLLIRDLSSRARLGLARFALALSFIVAAPALAQDQDADTIPDSSDNCVSIPNLNQLDGDGDGVGDVCDNCIDVANGPLGSALSCDSQEDADGDGFGNACDTDLKGMSRLMLIFSERQLRVGF